MCFFYTLDTYFNTKNNNQYGINTYIFLLKNLLEYSSRLIFTEHACRGSLFHVCGHIVKYDNKSTVRQKSDL